MNARILRKWSIHTKNLMSCSVFSLVVVVLLLLVTCAPSLILATMNFRSDASLIAAAKPPQTQHLHQYQHPQQKQQHLLHMPKNLIKEATLSSSSSSLPSSSSSSSSTLLTTLLSSLPNRNHRLAASSSSSVSAKSSSSSHGVEVVKTADIDRDSFPHYYNNYPTDDTRQLPPPPASASTAAANSYLSSGSGGISSRFYAPANSRHPLYSNNDNLGYLNPFRGWSRPQQHQPLHQHLPLTQSMQRDVTTYNDNIKPALYNHNINTDEDNDEDDDDQYDLEDFKENNDRTSSMESFRTGTAKRNFPMQQQYFNVRRLVDGKTHHVALAPAPLTHIAASTKSLLQLQRLAASTTTTDHLKTPQPQTELIPSNININNNNNLQNLFSTLHNKSVVPKYENPLAGNKTNFNTNMKIKSSSSLSTGLPPLRFIIESYEVPASLPLAKELTEQQRRMLIHEQHLKQLRSMQQQAARSRRESLHGHYKKYEKNELLTASSSASSATNFRKSPQNHNLRQHQQQHQHQQRLRKHSRRYCSARDPAQLAFEAPTVFEGKIVSMTPDRRQNFSATVEVREVFKQQIGYRLQKYLRLQFAYRNNSGECDIYREQLRPRGLVRGDTIEPGRMYLLFVQQIDIGNFTILGQPIRKTKRVVEAVRYAVSGNYGEW